MKKLSFLVTLTMLLSCQIWSQAKDEVVSLETPTGTLQATLWVPEGSQESPVVLIIPGSGPTDRDGNNAMMSNNSLRLLSEGLYENGIASLRFDKRGVGESASAMAREEDLRFETYIKDVEDWAGFLKKDSRFNQLVVLGHSEGSLIGMVAARNTGADKFISVAGVGRPAAEIIREQLEAQPAGIKEMTDPILDALESGRAIDSVSPMLFSLFRPSVQPYLISWFRYDPRKEIALLKCPVLILQGTTDIQVKVADAEQLSDAYPGAQKIILDGMNHILKEAPVDRMANLNTYNDPSLPLSDGLIESIVTFIRKK
jgi:pimeloyl-ACP methyl ester carboxylesterase